MTSVGNKLRSARESQGRAIAKVAEELCMTQRFVCALEADDLKVLPGIFFYKAFVRQYVALLGLDQKLFSAQLQSIESPSEAKPAPAPIKRLEAPRLDRSKLQDVKKAAAAAVGFQRFVELFRVGEIAKPHPI